MRRKLPTWRALPGLAVAAAAVVGTLLSLPQEDGFPHEEHAGLFPTCEGCHAGIPTGDEAAHVTIGPEGCANCHDGVDLERVDWTGPTPEPSNLVFSHPEHAAELADEGRAALECVDCHGVPGARVRMAVARAEPAVCLECHAPEAPEHFAAEVRCETCHVPLARAAALPPARIADFPRPASHAAADFLLAHGGLAEAGTADCAVCHTRDSCERCHLNAAEVPAIAGLAEDARVASLVADRPGEWPEPPSHRAEDWIRRHPDAARRDIADCATCHTRSSCAACHGEGRPAVAARLPSAGPEGPRGVRVTAVVPVGHEPTFFDRHGTAAAIGVPECSACHTERQCIACHDGVERPGFHPLDFVVRHGAEAFAERTECAACHSREAFCRDCHRAVGTAAERRLGSGGAFHDAQPDWLLAHGQAARQNLESCVACHEERSCLRCHSARTGLRVSPHGPGFDPSRVADRSTQSCGICHFDLPEGVTP